MAAGFDGHVDRRTARILGTGSKGFDLGVRAAESAVIPFADDPILLRNDATDHGVGFDAALAFARQRDGPAHHTIVELVRFVFWGLTWSIGWQDDQLLGRRFVRATGAIFARTRNPEAARQPRRPATHRQR